MMDMTFSAKISVNHILNHFLALFFSSPRMSCQVNQGVMVLNTTLLSLVTTLHLYSSFLPAQELSHRDDKCTAAGIIIFLK